MFLALSEGIEVWKGFECTDAYLWKEIRILVKISAPGRD